jgi:hypothetical protein
MIAIPAGRAAVDAWAALPADVRSEAVRLAALGEAHPDPAVAAVVVGRVRDGGPRPWYRTALLIGSMIGFFGAGLALLLAGGEIDDANAPEILVFGFVAFGAFLVAFVAQRMPDKPTIMRYAEIPNLRVLLRSADFAAEPASTPATSGQGKAERWPPYVIVAVPIGVAIVAWLLIWGFDLPLRPAAGLRRSVFNLAVGALVVGGWAVVTWWRRRNARESTGVKIDPQGLRFGRRPIVPWPDLAGVSLTGPTPAYPDVKPQIVWQLREQPEVRTPLHADGRTPERTILLARGYQAELSGSGRESGPPAPPAFPAG